MDLKIALSENPNNPCWLLNDFGPSANQKCVGLYDPINAISFGLLYNGYTIDNANFPPTDWGIPTKTNWDTLHTYLGGTTVSGGKMKEEGFLRWNSPNTSATNSSNYTSIGAGYRFHNGTYYEFKNRTFATLRPVVTSGSINTNGTGEYNISDDSGFWTGDLSDIPKIGSSVRFIYTGGSTPGSTVSDYDSNTYNVVQVGTQYWIRQNWKCTHLNNGTALTNVTSDATWSNATTGNYYYCPPNGDSANI